MSQYHEHIPLLDVVLHDPATIHLILTSAKNSGTIMVNMYV